MATRKVTPPTRTKAAKSTPAKSPPTKKPAPPPDKGVDIMAVLELTGIPGVYRNRVGVLVDSRGVSVSFKELKVKDKARWEQALDGGAVEQPADFLKAVCMDPSIPLHVRLDTAKAAAPFFTPKRLAVQGVEGAAPIALMTEYGKLPPDKLAQAEEHIRKALSLVGITQT